MSLIKWVISLGLLVSFFHGILFAQENDEAAPEFPECDGIKAGETLTLAYKDLNNDGKKELFFRIKGSIEAMPESVPVIVEGKLQKGCKDSEGLIYGVLSRKGSAWQPVLLGTAAFSEDAFEKPEVTLLGPKNIIDDPLIEVVVEFRSAGSTGTVYSYLFVWKEPGLKKEFFTMLAKHGGMIGYKKNEVTKITLIPTPFQDQTPYVHSFRCTSSWRWEKGSFDPGAEYMILDGFNPDKMEHYDPKTYQYFLKLQKFFEDGGASWRKKPEKVMKELFPGRKFKVKYNVYGMAVVHLYGRDDPKEIEKKYLYQPFYEKIGKKSIWVLNTEYAKKL